MYYLAEGYHYAGMFDRALPLLEETLALRKAKLGPDHPETLSSMNNLADSYAALGRDADATLAYQAAITRTSNAAELAHLASAKQRVETG